jgi:Xaa-Pro aminopeptidase
MLPLSHYVAKRRELLVRLEQPTLFFAGGERARNYAANTYPYRADSNFLMLFADPEPDSVALLDPADGTTTLFLPARSTETAVWMGPAPSFDEMRERADVNRVVPIDELDVRVAEIARGRALATVAVSDSRTTAHARALTGLDLEATDPNRLAPTWLVDVLAEARIRKTAAELDEIRHAGRVTRDAFTKTMAATRPGVREAELTGIVEGAFLTEGCVPAYASIVSRRGEILHNHAHDGVVEAGDLVLIDAGAELPSGFGADITRAWPATGRFDPEQRTVYETVLAAHERAIDATRAGVRYRDVHFAAARVIAEGLRELGVLRGPTDTLLEVGAHALFFPHGVGHFLGLDTHDLRVFGDRVLLAPGRTRSTQFGTEFLRIDRDLEPGMVVTIEPGMYFVPAILHRADFRERFREHVDFDRAETFLARGGGRGFGGVRIEDDVLVTDGEAENLTPGIPQTVDDVEAAVGSGVPSRCA